MTSLPGPDYTRVTDDASVLCRRQDFPRALNILQRRRPDHRRWRLAFGRVAAYSSNALIGARRSWMGSALHDVLECVDNRWLQRELAVELYESAPEFRADDVIPAWTPRGIWREAETVGLPMEYLTRVTVLPRHIDAPLDTARAVVDFRRVATAHRTHAVELSRGLSAHGVCEALPLDQMLLKMQIDAQRDAADRWRALSRRLLVADLPGL